VASRHLEKTLTSRVGDSKVRDWLVLVQIWQIRIVFPNDWESRDPSSVKPEFVASVFVFMLHYLPSSTNDYINLVLNTFVIHKTFWSDLLELLGECRHVG
jgi:hypothetical protein